jgi:hypothetical protein
MPRDGSSRPATSVGKLDVLRVTWEKCGRSGCYTSRSSSRRSATEWPGVWHHGLTNINRSEIAAQFENLDDHRHL